ncbi:MAG: secretin N-terminal domain-containing protein [Thiobacillus sp.]
MQRQNYFLLGLLLTSLSGLPGCASKGLTEGRQLVASGKTQEGLARLRAGLAEEPGNIELKQYYHTLREQFSNEVLLRAQRDIDAGNFESAEVQIRQVLSIHPENPRAEAMLAHLASNVRYSQTVAEAEKLLSQGKPQQAIEKAQTVLAQTVSHPGAESVIRRAQTSRAREEIAPRALATKFQKTVTLEFRDAPVRNIFDVISRQSGINFVFDKDVRLDSKASLFARDTPISEAVELLLATGGLDKKVVNPNTLLIYPNLPQKQKDYKELVIKSFYLGNADVKTTLIMLKSLLKARDVFVDERLNLLIVRDTPEVVRLAEKLIAVQDLPESEVMLEVEILEVKRSKLSELGVQYPNQFSLLFVPPATSAVVGAGGSVITTTPSPASSALTVQSLKRIAANQIAISPTPTVNLRKDDSDVNILANPRIRVKNREKAKIHIGDKVPVITSNATSTGVISESVSYLDVGLKLDVEPIVMQRDDVQIKVNLEVSNIVREIRSGSGTLTYQIGTRNAGTTLRLKNGETQVLAGLISDEDRTAGSRIPGLGDLPVMGRLFSNQRDERNKTEIVLLITPRVLRTVESREPTLTEFKSGTESSIGGASNYSSQTSFDSANDLSVDINDALRAQDAARAIEAAEAQGAAAAAAAGVPNPPGVQPAAPVFPPPQSSPPGVMQPLPVTPPSGPGRVN